MSTDSIITGTAAPTPREHHLRVSRTARFVTLGPLDEPVDDVWFVCHGYGQLASEFLQPFRALENGRTLIVAPEGLSRFYREPQAQAAPNTPVGASWMTRDDRDHEIEDYVAFLDGVYGRVFERLDRSAVRAHALGFSQGVATATRWTVLGIPQVDRLVLWAGEVPPDLDVGRATARLAPVRVVCVVGTDDRYATSAALAQQRARLQGLGIEPKIITFEGGHHLSTTVLRELATA